MSNHPPILRKPSLNEIGLDLIRLSRRQRFTVFAVPLVSWAAYFAFASLDWWLPAVFALVAFSRNCTVEVRPVISGGAQ